MKLVTYERNSKQAVGVVKDNRVFNATSLLKRCGYDAKMACDMLTLLDAGAKVMKTLSSCANDLEKSERRAGSFPLNKVKLLAPLPIPRNMFALAGNYAEHIEEGGRKVTKKDTITPRIFMKPASKTATAPGQPIVISRPAQLVGWEAELGVVIGRRGKYITPERALGYVAGYTCFNDISERKLQIRKRNESAEWDRFFDWLNGKWCDRFAPMGPYIVTKDEIRDPQRLELTLSVNGKTQQNANTAQMIFSVAEIVSYLSHLLTIEPGDIIATGTPAGAGGAKRKKLKVGDIVSMEIEKIGSLVNPVIAER